MLDGQPWRQGRITYQEAPGLARHLTAACLLIIGYIDVLRQLMDHKTLTTTAGYYRVSLKRKRAAVDRLRLHVVDHNGRAAPMASAAAYRARSVAVPFGNCIEPQNVKVGG
jgi:hypothetical protein